MSYPIEDIEGIGKRYAAKLRKLGIKRTHHLLDRAASKKGRKELAAESGLDEKLILKWANMADLMRIRGVGEEYSELLEAAGVDTVKELRNRKPAHRHGRSQWQAQAGAPAAGAEPSGEMGGAGQEAAPGHDLLRLAANPRQRTDNGRRSRAAIFQSFVGDVRLPALTAARLRI
ncbi:MAG: hypothetical protein Kow0032_01380 [Methyloligellaceae bacterium]